jgi:hypothetical protein
MCGLNADCRRAQGYEHQPAVRRIGYFDGIHISS